MRLFALLPLLGCLGFVSEPVVPAPPPNATAALRPNILLVVADDLGLDKVGVYDAGDDATRPLTPHIDGVAARGVTFRKAYVNPTCSPTRAALLTGRNHHSVGFATIAEMASGFPGSNAFLPRTAATIAEVLKSKGYATAIVGKWHLGDQPEFLPTRQGFEHSWFSGFHDDVSSSKAI